uniref:DNA mismatch repair proteins mutS family domain-containing protein n=1 Tax=viral metagenome TaxID=1070528 RepID=A0A6C0BVP6_9ZZZZ
MSLKDLNTSFKLPIEYDKETTTISDELISDLELVDTSGNNGLYKHVFNAKTRFGLHIANTHSKYYTPNKKYLNDSQTFMKQYCKTPLTFPIHERTDDVCETWLDIKNDNNFIDKYQYVDVKVFTFLNRRADFLQFLSMFNLSAPFLSLVFPIFMLIIPFFIIKFQNHNITFENYVKFLKVVVQRNSLGNLVLNFGTVPMDKKIYLSLSAALYVFQIYQNTLSCIKFYKNIRIIHQNLFLYRDYISSTIANIDRHLQFSNQIDSYQPFNKQLLDNKNILQDFNHCLSRITPYKMSYNKLSNIGELMKCYYELYDNKYYTNALNFSYGFNGYLECLNGLKANIIAKNINFCKISAKKPTKFKKAYYAPLIKTDPVSNTYDLDKNRIITGPNASGKTTLLKTSLFNIILSQQLGCGFYKSATINPYHKLHCYLNIPDTSGRDSLFQAEARRCKDILDEILENNNQRHFCIFDEIYSGTNPYEAISGAYAFLSYLTSCANHVDFMLTTHYVSLCEKLDANPAIINNHMKINNTNNVFEYLYKLEDGISTVKGGVKVFNDLDYPETIIADMKRTINNVL